MGRTTVYRTDVEKARNALILRGINPSLDAIRVELGNTGSKSTIHKFLREIEGDGAADGDQEKLLGNEISALVAKLAARLKHESDERVTEIRAAADAQLTASAEALSRQNAETQRLAGAVDRLEAKLGDECAAHADTRGHLQRATVTIGQLEERASGLEQRIVEHEAHAKSLETKHAQAREALEHFRTAVKEQREQDLRRHEHHVQTLQRELRQAQDAVASKNHELLQLNRDNARLAENVGQLEKEVSHLRAEVRERDHQLKALRPLATEHRVLETRCAHAEAMVVSLTTERAELQAALAGERSARQASEVDRARVAALEDVVARISEGRTSAASVPVAGAPQPESPD